MSSSTISAIVRLLRPVNMGIAFLTIAAGGVLSDPSAVRWPEILLAAAAGALIVGGGNALNDCFDIDIDRLNRPERPLPSGALSIKQANALWVTLSIVGVTLSYSITPWNLYLSVFWVFALYYYSRVLKKTVLAGNLTIGVLTGTAFLFGAVVTGNAATALFPGLFAFLVNVTRELLKDVEDVEGDRQAGAATLPVRYGTRASLLTAAGAIIALVAATILPYVLNIYTITYLWIVLAVDAALLFVLLSWWRDESLSNLRRLSGILKLAMVVGLVALFAGS
jgi:geranylgeranylglycerol-phosphate geranylgeranyltransferase